MKATLRCCSLALLATAGCGIDHYDHRPPDSILWGAQIAVPHAVASAGPANAAPPTEPVATEQIGWSSLGE